MTTIKKTLSKFKHHISQKEFKQIETIALFKFSLAIVNICLFTIGLMLLRYVTVDVLNDLRQNIQISEEKIFFDKLITVINGIFQYILAIVIFFDCLSNVIKNEYFSFLKNFICYFIIFSIVVLPIKITSTTLVPFLFIFLGIGFFLKRLIYIKKLDLLRDLYVISPASKFGFFKRTDLNFVVYSPSQLTQINKKWLPFINVTLEGDSRTVLDEDWDDKYTSHNYSIVIQSKLSGLTIKQATGIDGHIVRVVAMPKNANILNKSEEK